jgi:hypothetical protein
MLATEKIKPAPHRVSAAAEQSGVGVKVAEVVEMRTLE